MENNTEIKEIPEVVVKKPGLSIGNAIVCAAIIIAVAIIIGKEGTGTAAVADTLDLVSSVTEEDFVRGDENAPITIIEYADFSCGYCAQYHPTLQKIVEGSEGQVRWVYRHLPIFNIDAAMASQCVGTLGGEESFWNFSDKLYANQDRLSSEFYLASALGLGVDEASYNTCIANPVLKKQIMDEFNRNKILLGFNATPYTVLIDKVGRKFSFAGALPYDNIQSLIDTLDK